MDLSKILSISGKPGLYQVISQSNRGVVVASLQDGKKMAIGQTQRVSTLSDISIYTMEGDEPLKDIFKSFHEYAGGESLSIDVQDKQALRDFFLEILPDHDEERVYPSDVKKMVKWYNTLLENSLLSFDESEEEAESAEEVADEGATE